MAQHPGFSQQDRYPSFNIGDISPESPGSITMADLGPPVDINIVLQTLPDSRGQQGFAQHQGLPPPICQWIQGPSPWTAVKAVGDQPVSTPFNQLHLNFMNYRSPPSEADTVSQSIGRAVTDSGYGSNTRQSVGNPSVHGELEQSVISRLQEIGREDDSSREDGRRRERQGQRSTPGTPTGKGIVCPDCKVSVKTYSELKKHQARHSRPHRCPVPGCRKADNGFATKNDLDRHTKSVHKLHNGDETVYRCDVGQCKDKPKDWPRLDNFRQHLKRKHDMEGVDLERFTFRISRSDFTNLGPSEAGPSGSLMAGSTFTSESPWEGMDHGHVAPTSLITGHSSQLLQLDNTMGSARFSAVEGRESVALNTDSFHYPIRNSAENSRPCVTGPAPLVRIMQRSSLEGTSSETLSGANQPTCVAPAVLSQACPESKPFGDLDIQVQQPTEETEFDAQESTPDVPQGNIQSQVDKMQSPTPDDMKVDLSMQGSASEDGLHDANPDEDEPPENLSDVQSNLLRNAGAQYPKAEDVHVKASPSQVQLGSETPRPIDLDDETQASAFIESLIKKGKLGEVLKKLGYPALDDTDTKGQRETAPSSTTNDDGRANKCNKCDKVFQRRCELTKHQQRHAKPYACTFANCPKKFGSKSDWMRHENNQHEQLEIWRCAEKSNDQRDRVECRKVCHRRESLKAHLEKDHGIHDLAVLDKKLDDRRMGRNFQSRFWCGFCRKTIEPEPTGKGGPAHSERFDHIDDHFKGRNGMPKADIKDWKHVDVDHLDPPDGSPGKPRRSKGQPTAPAGNSRKRAYGGDGDDGGSRAKRFRDGRGKVWFWTCCCCGGYWKMSTTLACMNICNHEFCDHCVPHHSFEHEVSPEPEVLPPVSDLGAS
ncbi:hypothetical protein C7999DRAFT_16857 [Corynascus novoguineensis]|uniref:C2H2-type domain-containing protein n=1 Tax=Corynascus novoguineensis TaxID=1126955 RepID=A0AAN7CP92_9PEZI|nr:hypothetical protein C7999DRAFT_16857 [Corynascus novoguineensis]